MEFEQLKLDPRILAAIKQTGFHQATRIQQEAIPIVLSGEDLMASAQTGTGKTAAFVLPALQHLLRPSKMRGQGPRVARAPAGGLRPRVVEGCRGHIGHVWRVCPAGAQVRSSIA